MQNHAPNNKLQFEELASIQIKDGFFLVISLRDDGRVSIAQQVQTMVGGKMFRFFLKNAIEVDPSGLVTIVELIQKALERLFELESSL